MTNAELLAKIKTEIRRMLNDNSPYFDVQERTGGHIALAKLSSFLDTLESEKPMNQEELEQEIIKCWQEWISPSNKQSVDGVLPLSEFAFYARHFAQWGADHFRDTTKKVSEDLEEAAGKWVFENCFDCDIVGEHRANDGFIAGAKWQAEQDKETIELAEDHAYLAGAVNEREKMLKEAVEGTVMDFSSNQPRPQVDVYVDPNKYCTGEKVRIIIVKEDEK